MFIINKLFSGRSLIRFNKQYKVQCYWFCVDRDQPVVPYQELIIDYDPNKEGIDIAESAVNESFTEQEIISLQNYLETIEVGLEVTKADYLPVASDINGLQHFLLGGGTGIIYLSEYEGYSLLFKVWGIYDYKDKDDLVYCPEV